MKVMQQKLCDMGFCSFPTPARKRLSTILFAAAMLAASILSAQLYSIGARHRMANDRQHNNAELCCEAPSVPQPAKAAE